MIAAELILLIDNKQYDTLFKLYVKVNMYVAETHCRFCLWGDNRCEIPYNDILHESAGQAAGISKTAQAQ